MKYKFSDAHFCGEMQVILLEKVNKLGALGEEVTVKNGYGRNFLIPQKFAVEASPSNLKQMEEKMKQKF